jgi:hypothetical protein
MKILLNIFIIILITIFGVSCASLISGTSQDIYINSNPEGATIFDGGLKVGRTPATITIKKSGLGDKEITLTLEGYERRTFVLRKSFDAVAILNLAGVIGWAVDFATGAIMKYDRTNYDIDLDPKAFNIEELEKDQLGRLIIPNEENSVIVYYKDADIKLLFH